MSFTTLQFSSWDDNTFEEFIEFKKSLQSDLPTFFPEKLDDYKKILHSSSEFSKDYQWIGFLIKKNNLTVAKAILSWRNGSRIGNLGFIDWINSPEIAAFLMNKVESYGKSIGLNEIKTPIDLNFFVKYRIKCIGGKGEPYFGEPIYPDYYHDLFLSTGYKVVGTWDTYLITRFRTFTNLMKKRKKLEARKDKNDKKVKIRLIKMTAWDSEIEIIYRMFVDSFKEMPEFESISLAQFKLIYDDFKYIIHPLLSYIVELDGAPVGFSINYPDPLAILSKFKYKELSKAQKILLLIRLRLNFKTLLMPYMGKVKGPKGEDVKGVFLKISKLLTYGVLVADKALVCYQSPDSPSKRPIDPNLVEEYAKYVLYGKKL